MADYIFRPIVTWPRPFTKDRRSLSGETTFTKVLDRLETEMDWLSARSIVIQTAHRGEDLRQDGMLRSSARVPAHPGVIISFEARARRAGKEIGPLSYACDTYWTWKDNLRGIVLTLEALRAVDRYGATTSGEQYRGWAALPTPEPAGFATVEDAARWLCTIIPQSRAGTREPVDLVLRDAERYRNVYRAAARILHPDAGGDTGSEEQFKRLQEVRRMLDQHHEGKP